MTNTLTSASAPMSAAETAIRGLIDQFVKGWNTADGEACARPFALNADFTAVNGLRARGRDLIARGHNDILTTIFCGTRLTAAIHSIEFLRPDVASVDLTLRLTPAGQTWLPKYTCCGMIVTEENGAWSIDVFRNFVPFERPLASALDANLYQASKQAAEAATGQSA